MADNREHERFACDLEAELQYKGGTLTARTEDISYGGVCLWIDRALPVATPVRVSLTLLLGNDASSEPLVLPARIVWCTKLAEGHQIGCMFVHLENEQLRYLELFMRFLRGEGPTLSPPSRGDSGGSDVDPDSEPFA